MKENLYVGLQSAKLSIQQYFNMVIKFQEQGIEISPNGPTDPGQKKKFRPQKPLKLLDHM